MSDIQPSINETVRPISWRRLIRAAVAGGDYDVTTGPLGRAIVLLAIPMMLEMIMESVFAVVDIFFVSRLGAEAVATVGVTEAVLTLLYAVAGGLAMATTAMVARRVGEKRHAEASRSAGQAILMGLIVSVISGAAAFHFAPQLLKIMGASDALIHTGSGYTRVLLGANVVIMLLFIINAVFRGAGNPGRAMQVLWLANLLNLVLDPCLIFGLGPFPEMGVTGAAVATTIGRGTGVLFQIYLIRKDTNRVRVGFTDLKPDLVLIRRLLRVSAGGIGQFIIATASWIGLMRIMAVFGSASLAGYAIAIRIIIFTLLPSWGLSNAAATMVGQNLGASRPERAERAVWITGAINMGFLSLVAVFFFVLAGPVVALFTDDPAVWTVAVDCIRFLCVGYLFYGLGMVMVQAFNGAGDTVTPSWINLVCFWMVEIPLAWWLAIPGGYSERGVFVAIIVAESLASIMGLVLFRRGRWKGRVV